MLAPRSSFDLMASGIVFWSGIHLLAVESLFRKFGGVYSTLAQIGQEWVWGLIFIGLGLTGIVMTLWPRKPPFLPRLLARMSITFYFMTLVFNNLGNPTLPLSTATYVILALSGFWGIWRTHSSGR